MAAYLPTSTRPLSPSILLVQDSTAAIGQPLQSGSDMLLVAVQDTSPNHDSLLHTSAHRPGAFSQLDKWCDIQLGCLPSTHLANYVLNTQTPALCSQHATPCQKPLPVTTQKNGKPLDCPPAKPAGTQQVLAAHLLIALMPTHNMAITRHTSPKQPATKP